MRRLKHASPVPNEPAGERPPLPGPARTDARPTGGGRREFANGQEPPLRPRSPELTIRAPAHGARYPSRRARPHGPGAGDRGRQRGIGVAGILMMGLVMLGIAAAMMTHDLLVPAFARAAVAADEAPLRAVSGEPVVPNRRS